MGTVKTHGDLARVKARNPTSITDLITLGLVNGILENIYQQLVFVESNLVYAETSITTAAGDMEYTPEVSFNGFLRDGVWVDGETTYLAELTEADKVKYDYGSTTSRPEGYYLTEDGKVGFLWVPDDEYTIYAQYWKPLTALDDYDDDDLPWGGIWNQAIERLLVVEILEILERDNSRQAILADIEWDKAMNMVYARGIRQRRQVSDMFTVDGI
jgi:hypothetical protein